MTNDPKLARGRKLASGEIWRTTTYTLDLTRKFQLYVEQVPVTSEDSKALYLNNWRLFSPKTLRAFSNSTNNKTVGSYRDRPYALRRYHWASHNGTDQFVIDYFHVSKLFEILHRLLETKSREGEGLLLLTRMGKCVDLLGDATIFSTLDKNSGYW